VGSDFFSLGVCGGYECQNDRFEETKLKETEKEKKKGRRGRRGGREGGSEGM